MDVTQKYTTEVEPTQITITYDFIDNLQRDEDVTIDWQDIVNLMERLDNDIDSSCSLGHVFTTETNQFFIELFFELDENSKDFHYIVDHYEIIDSDRFLDLILDNKRVSLSKERVRSIV